ncbi:unnamed protein product [Effrenium voratum]|nr:unnamed protein product [Effrenium voratum]
MSAISLPTSYCREAMSVSASSASPSPEWLPLPRLAKEEMHVAGLCVPCLFHSSKADGCRKGDACSHCHFCSRSEVSHRRKALHLQMKRKDAAQMHQENSSFGCGQAIYDT